MFLHRRNLLRSCLFLLTTLAATSARAADSYLKVIPGTALAFCGIQNIGEASDKIQKLATVVQAPGVSALDEFKKESGIAKGLNEKGSAGFFVLPGQSDKEPWMVAFLAVADYKEFLGNFTVVKAGDPISEVKSPKGGKARFVAQRNGYALIAVQGDRAALEAALATKQDISAEVASLTTWLTENDAVAVGTAAGIKLAAKAASDELKSSKENIPAGPEAAVLRPIMELYGKAIGAAPKELSLAAAGIRGDQQGAIHIDCRARLVDGGQIAKAVAGIPPVTENLLAEVPGGQFFLAMGGVSTSAFLEGYMKLAFGLMKNAKDLYGIAPEDIDQMSKDAMETVRSIHSMGMVMKIGKRTDPIYSNIYGTLHVDNAKQLLSVQEKYIESAGKRIANGKSGIFKSMTAKRLDIAGKPALQIELAMSLPNLPGGEAGSPQLLDQMLGPGGKMLIYYVAQDEHTVVMGMSVSPERMAAVLDMIKQPKKCLAVDPEVAVTTAMLPSGAQWVAYVNFRGYAKLIQRTMAAALPPQAMERAMIPDFPQSPPLGIAVKASPAEIDVKIAVPAALIKATGEYVKEVQKMFMQRMMEQNPTPVP